MRRRREYGLAVVISAQEKQQTAITEIKG